LREASDGKDNGHENRYVVRYFIIDDEGNLYYTMNYAALRNFIRQSTTFSDLFSMVNKHFKSIKMSEIKVGKVQAYKNPEMMPFLNQSFFDVEILLADQNEENSTIDRSRLSGKDNKKRNSYKLMFFTFKDQHLTLMNQFLLSYASITEEQKAKELETPVTIISKPIEKQDLTSSNSRLNEKIEQVRQSIDKLFGIVEEVERQESSSFVQQEQTETTAENEPQDDTADTQKKEEKTIPDGVYIPANNTQVLSYASGVRYSGNLKEGKAHGKGKEFFKQGITYSGDYVNGKRHGKGFFLDEERNMCYVECIEGKVSGI